MSIQENGDDSQVDLTLLGSLDPNASIGPEAISPESEEPTPYEPEPRDQEPALVEDGGSQEQSAPTQELPESEALEPEPALAQEPVGDDEALENLSLNTNYSLEQALGMSETVRANREDAPNTSSTRSYQNKEGSDWSLTDEHLILPQYPNEDFVKILEDIGFEIPRDPKDYSEPLKVWLATISEAFRCTHLNTPYDKALRDKTRRWKQVINHQSGNSSVRMTALPINIKNDLDPERTSMYLASIMSSGQVMHIPLWHSGFWVTIRTPSDEDLINLNERLIAEKTQLGRQTYGHVLGSSRSFISGYLFDMICAHITDSSVSKEVGDILPLISSLDLDQLAWGWACTIWPNGWKYLVPTIGDINQPEVYVKQTFRVATLSQVDDLALTESQRAHMAKYTSGSMSLSSIKTYQADFARNVPDTLDLGNGVVLHLQIPTLIKSLNDGQAWVNSLISTYANMNDMPVGASDRERYFRAQMNAAILREYQSMVAKIETPLRIIDDEEEIGVQLAVISRADGVREKFFTKINDFIQHRTVSVIAIPVESDKLVTDPVRRPYLMSIDPITAFFTLLSRRITRILGQ